MTHQLVRVACLSVTSIAALAGAARAEDAAPPTPPATPLFFPTLGADGLGSGVDLRVGLTHVDGADESLTRAELGVQGVNDAGLGGYGRIALSSVEDMTALSNVEAGALYRARGRTTDTTFRVGLVLPSGPGLDDDSGDAFVNLVATELARPSDLATGFPETTALRLAVAPTYRSGQLVLRADAGLDVFLDSIDGEDLEPLWHVDLAGGYEGEQVGVTAELTTVGSTDSDAEGTFHLLSLGVQGRRGKLTPFGTVSIPFSTEDDIDAYNLFAGLRAGF